MAGRTTLLRFAIGPDGKRYISVDSFRDWVNDDRNVHRAAALMAQGDARGHHPLEVLRRGLLFPVWDAEKALDKQLDAQRAAAKNN